ncbi:MAG: polyphenol oxidase family protein, partial [Parcubacteria group bacterium]|nr:polyphenol oxidase family protein [Parcubacteria group bacterium]
MSDLDDLNKFKEIFYKEFVISRKELKKYIKGDFSGKEFKLFLKANNLGDKKLVFQEQKHTDNVKLVGESFLKKRDVILNNDAMITAEKNLYLCAYTADCVPITFFDPESKAIGIAHSGWRGTLNLIAHKTARMMNNSFKINYASLKCYLGPSIMDCCYEIGMAEDSRVKDFVNQFGSSVIKKDKEKMYLNLHEAIKIQLKGLG